MVDMPQLQKDIFTNGFRWIQEIPDHWKKRIIKRDFEVTLGKMLQSIQLNDSESEEYYLRSVNIRWEGVDIEDLKTMWFSPEEKERLRLRYGDLLVNEGGDAGRSSLWKNEIENCYIQNAINRIRSRQGDFTNYLYYWLYLLKSIGYIDAIISRITISHLTAEKLERIVFLKPSKTEQRRISAYLDKACAAIDIAIEKKQKQLETLDALRKSIIYKAVTRGLDEAVALKESGIEWIELIPQHWNTDRLRDVTTKIGSGITPEGGGTVYVDEGIPLFRSQNIYFDGLHLDDIVYITEEQHRLMSNTHIQPGDVLLNITGASIGRCHYVPEDFSEANVNQHVCIIRPTEKLHFKFLFYFMASDAGQSQILSGFRGASRQGLNFREIKAFVLPLPPAIEQREICQYLDDEMTEFKKLKNNLELQLTTIEQYRKSLIHECVTGKRRITEDDLKEISEHV